MGPATGVGGILDAASERFQDGLGGDAARAECGVYGGVGSVVAAEEDPTPE